MIFVGVSQSDNHGKLRVTVWLINSSQRSDLYSRWRELRLATGAFFRHNYVQRMPRTNDNAKGLLLRIMVSEQINDALNRIADSGYIGHNRIDVAYRFIQDGVLEALDNPHLKPKRTVKPAKKR